MEVYDGIWRYMGFLLYPRTLLPVEHGEHPVLPAAGGALVAAAAYAVLVAQDRG